MLAHWTTSCRRHPAERGKERKVGWVLGPAAMVGCGEGSTNRRFAQRTVGIASVLTSRWARLSGPQRYPRRSRSVAARPMPEQLAVAFDKCCALEGGEGLAVFVSALFPHVHDSWAVRRSKPADERFMEAEMLLQPRPFFDRAAALDDAQSNRAH